MSLFKKIYLSNILLMLPLLMFGQLPKFQAAYIYNFSNYIEWPVNYKTGDFVIGVLGKDEVTVELKLLAAKKNVKGQAMSIVEYKDATDITKCHILFISKNQSTQIEEAIIALGSSNTLIIADKTSLINKGAGIAFSFDGSKLFFELSRNNITNRGLKINPALEKLALKVN